VEVSRDIQEVRCIRMIEVHTDEDKNLLEAVDLRRKWFPKMNTLDWSDPTQEAEDKSKAPSNMAAYNMDSRGTRDDIHMARNMGLWDLSSEVQMRQRDVHWRSARFVMMP